MAYPTLLIQQRIYQVLTGNADLMAKITGVFDHTPQGQAYPYVTIAHNDSLEGVGSHTASSFTGVLWIHSWSQALGRKEVKEIMVDVYGSLHKLDLNIEGFNTINMRFGTDNIDLDPDGKTYHGVQSFNLALGRK